MIFVRHVADQHGLPVCSHGGGVPSHRVLIRESSMAQHFFDSLHRAVPHSTADHGSDKARSASWLASKLGTNPHRVFVAA